MNERAAAVARVDGLLHEWCSLPVDLCPCAPQPLPEPARSPRVLRLQHAIRAESSCEALDDPAGPLTHGTPERAPERPHSPMTPLSPSYYRKAGAA